MEMEAEGIYKLPPIIYGAQIFSAKDVAERKDWGLTYMNMDKAWVTKGEGMVIAVLDTGMPNHIDLQDVFIEPKNFTNSADVLDRHGHGTHTSGTIGARENGQGIVGWQPKCKIVPVKVLGDDGSGAVDWIAAGINYAVDVGVDVISMSLGGGSEPILKQAIDRALSRGVYVVCAAGNDGAIPGQDTIGYPGKYPNIFTIGSFNSTGQLSSYSSRGPEIKAVFPGENVLSCWLGNSYRLLSGTSMATPSAAAMVSELISQQRKADKENKNVKIRIRNNVDLLEHVKNTTRDQGIPGFDNDWGWGILDTARFYDTVDWQPVIVPTPGTSPVQEADFGVLKVRYPVIVDGKQGFFLYVP